MSLAEVKAVVDEAHKKRFIPPLSMQILIENAIKHNIVDRAHPLKIEIGAQEGVLVVANNRHPRKAPPDSHGMGLSMLRKRYLYLTEGEIEVISDSSRFAVNAPLLETQL